MSNPQSGVFVQFYTDAVELKAESEKQGRPIFQDLPHIRKMIPGDASNVVERVAKEHDIRMYPREWEIFQRQQATGHFGTPSNLPKIINSIYDIQMRRIFNSKSVKLIRTIRNYTEAL